MEPNLIILGAALLFLLVATVILIVSMLSASRAKKTAAREDAQNEWHVNAVPPTQPVDTDLDGLVVTVAPGSPSAALLQPLRTGDWQPPSEIAPAEHLTAVSLAERTKEFDDIASPAAHERQVSAAPHVEEPVVLVMEPAVPEVTSVPVDPDRTSNNGESAAPPELKSEADYAERLASLPDVVTVAAASASPLTLDADEPMARAIEPSLPEVIVAPPAPLPPLPQEVAEQHEPTLEPSSPTSELQPELPLQVAEPLQSTLWQPPVVTGAPLVQSFNEEHPAAATQATGLEAPTVASAEAAPQPTKTPRPRASAHEIPAAALMLEGAPGIARGPELERPLHHPSTQIEMVAPVEMWFGDYRIGVKEGTNTHAQFRKYADVLLADLHGAGGRTR